MKKLLTILLLLPVFALAQNTTTLPTGIVSTQPQYFLKNPTDSLRQWWANFPGRGVNRLYTATEINESLRTSGSIFNHYADSLYQRAVNLFDAQTINGIKTYINNQIFKADLQGLQGAIQRWTISNGGNATFRDMAFYSSGDGGGQGILFTDTATGTQKYLFYAPNFGYGNGLWIGNGSFTGAKRILTTDDIADIPDSTTIANTYATKSLLEGKADKSYENTILYSANFATGIPSDMSNPNGWSATTGGITPASAGLSNYILLNKQYGIDKRAVQVRVTLGSNTVFDVFTRQQETVAATGTMVELDVATNTIKMFEAYDNGVSQPAVLLSKSYAFNTAHDYIITLVRDSSVNKFYVTDQVTGLTDSLIDATKESGKQYDNYAFAAISGTLPVVKSIKVTTAYKVGLPVFYIGDSITESLYTGLTNQKDGYAWKGRSVAGNIAAISSRSSGNIYGVLRRMKTEIAILKPIYVSVTIGTNGGNTTTLLNNLVDSIRLYGSTPVLNNIPWKSDGLNTTVNADIGSVRTAKAVNGALFDQATSTNFANVTQDQSVFINQGGLFIHPNATGHQQMFNRLKLDVPELFETTNFPQAWNQNGNTVAAADYTIGTNNNYGIHFETNGTEKMVLDSLGRLRIGNVSTTATLLASIRGTQAGLVIDRFAAGAPTLITYATRGSEAAKTAPLKDQGIWASQHFGYSGAAYPINGGGAFTVDAAENFTSTNMGTEIHFAVTPIGSTTRTTALSIFGDGSIGQGTPYSVTTNLIPQGWLALKPATTAKPSIYFGANGALPTTPVANSLTATNTGIYYTDTIATVKTVKEVAFTDVVITPTDADYVITGSGQFVKLPDITANRTLTLPAASAHAGKQIKIWNQNTSGTFNWSFAGATAKDAGNNTLTNLINSSVYVLESDGASWVRIN